MRDEKGELLCEADCPINVAIRSGTQSLRRLTISGRSGKPVAVDTHSIPVIGKDNTTQGAILIMHDASSETSLEERCQSLHKKATKDPLTKVANRAEFDRVHDMFVTANQQQKVPCSLIILDLDHFKLVNDNYGHQAGDDAIISVATLLRNSCRPGDLVARYGGEEFVMLCADCDNAAAARRSDQIRKTFSEILQPRMGGKSVTASFGVTEIQPGDTPETMLRRADRALLMAKGKGRNTVVQLGVGSSEEQAEEPRGFWFRRPSRPEREIERVMVSPVPVKLAIEKLRGFVADHRAKIIKINTNHVRMELNDRDSSNLKRISDRTTVFLVDLRFEEERPGQDDEGDNRNAVVRTKIHVAISPKRNRDRRQANFNHRAQEVLTSFRSYLMATDEEYQAPRQALQRVKRILTPWLTKDQE
jgi:diguanylate cyclase (GGDEF)-like protein